MCSAFVRSSEDRPARGQEGEGEEAERLPISDTEFKERRAHPAYKANLTCERTVSGLGFVSLATHAMAAARAPGPVAVQAVVSRRPPPTHQDNTHTPAHIASISVVTAAELWRV